MVCTIGQPCSLAHSRTRRLSEGVRLTVSHSLFVSYSFVISAIRASVAHGRALAQCPWLRLSSAHERSRVVSQTTVCGTLAASAERDASAQVVM